MGHSFSKVEHINKSNFVEDSVNNPDNIGKPFGTIERQINIDDSWIPDNNCNVFPIRSTSSLVIKGTMNAFAEAANVKINSFMSGLGNIFYSQGRYTQDSNATRDSSDNTDFYKNTIIKSGFSVQLDSDEFLMISPVTDLSIKGVSIINFINNPNIDPTCKISSEIEVILNYNNTQDIKISAGDIIAIGTIIKLGNSNQINCGNQGNQVNYGTSNSGANSKIDFLKH